MSESARHSQLALVTAACSGIGAAAVALGNSLIWTDVAPRRAGSGPLLGRWCFDVADEVGRAVAWLMSDASSCITGLYLLVDLGVLAGMACLPYGGMCGFKWAVEGTP